MTKNILNRISSFLIKLVLALMVIALGYYLFRNDSKEKVYNYTDLLITYKNCIIVGKTEVHDNLKLYLSNPYLKDKKTTNMIDYKVCVTKEVYLYSFIGDTIGKTKFVQRNEKK